MLDPIVPRCEDQDRRNRVRHDPAFHGIDYVEIVTAPAADNQRVLKVFFIPKAPDHAASLEALLDAFDGATDAVQITGGTRVLDVRVLDVQRAGDHLEVRVDRPGDFSTYTLRLQVPAQASGIRLDPVFARVDFDFKAGCPSRFDCRTEAPCPPEPVDTPRIDYLAKDYASFRQALLDLIPTRIPGWEEEHEADLLVTLAEVMAYTADHLSYHQDAVANEAYLETARHRISVRRHAHLIDYRMHDGVSARTFVHIAARDGEGPFTVPAGATVLTRVHQMLQDPVGGAQHAPPHGAGLADELSSSAQSSARIVFELMEAVRVHRDLNELAIYTWGDAACCLPRGTTALDLEGDHEALLQPGDYLLFEEKVAPDTGAAADADPAHRQVVRLTRVTRHEDPLRSTVLTRVAWGADDALSFPLCVSVQRAGTEQAEVVSVARGNLGLALHGRAQTEPHPSRRASTSSPPGFRLGPRAYRFRLDEGPLSFRMPFDNRKHLAAARRAPDEHPVQALRAIDPQRAEPRVELAIEAPSGTTTQWTAVPDLLASDAFSEDVAVETDNEGRAVLRFGDDVFGKAPPEGARAEVTYRTGVGAAGNVGAEALVHVVLPSTDAPRVAAVRNPLPAWGGVDPEALERVRRVAPEALHAETHRAVTEADYARMTERHPAVSKARATFRWTGSWHTVFVRVDPKGRAGLPDALRDAVHDHVARYALAGYDLAIKPPHYAPLDIELEICAGRDHFREDVAEAVRDQLFGAPSRPAPGFFHPDRFTFGEPLSLSRLYAAVEAVEGVDSVRVRRFRRQDQLAAASAQNLEQGFVRAAPQEVLRLDNDPNFPEHGVLRLEMIGGR